MRWNHVTGILFSFVALLGILFTSWPVPDQEFVIPFDTGDATQGILSLSVPTWLKIGDTAEIRLQVEFAQGMSNLDENGRIDLVSRLELGFIEFTPQGEGHVSIGPGSPVTMVWKLQPSYESDYSGTVWLFQQLSGQESQLILAKRIDLSAKRFMGFSYLTARFIFIGLLFVGIFFGLVKFKKRKS
jgi:hypothetical protein